MFKINLNFNNKKQRPSATPSLIKYYIQSIYNNKFPVGQLLKINILQNTPRYCCSSALIRDQSDLYSVYCLYSQPLTHYFFFCKI